MRRTFPIAILCLVCLFFFFPGTALADSKAVLSLPVLGINGLADDLYLYSCSDASCASVTQLSDYGHITNVPRWPKSNGGPGGTPPAIWVFLNIPGSGYKYYQLWQNAGDCWKSCIFGINAQGELDNSATTCAGTVATAPKGANGVASFTLGAAMFSQATCGTPPAKMSSTNTLPGRSLTFLNGTSAETVCLQTDSSFNHPECTGANKVTTQFPYVIGTADLIDGSNSGVVQVSGVQPYEGAEWIYTGKGVLNHQVYATKLEWTVWPQHAENTMAPTFIDISLVDGFNMGVTLKPDRDCVCSVADSEGGVPYFVLYKAGQTMADFPSPVTVFSNICPQGNEAPISQDNKYGCYSSCSKAKYYGSSDQDQLCCTGAHNTPSTCTDPPGRPYVQNINKYSDGVYAWAFNDWRGTFTCEPTASVTFTLKEIDEAL